jgi:GNAT superfamily N-acetyltransferase
VGEPDLVLWLLDDWALERALPKTVYLSVREEHESAVQTWYDNTGDRRPMTRMALTGDILLPTAPAPGVVRLGPEAADGIAALYAQGGSFTPDAFAATQLADGVFFGVAAEDGGLLAVGGTHIVDRTSGVAAIGNMYTHPAARGRGHAGAILAALVATLRAEGISTIVLNVDRRNATAIRLYERHGFTVHCFFVEGKARRIRKFQV